MRPKRTAVSVAHAKRDFSDLLGRVAYGGETFLITRRGRPMAKLVPLTDASERRSHLTGSGWLDEDDPFFELIEETVSRREQHRPRAFHSRRRRRSGGRAR